MSEIVIEIVVVLLLIIANGVFAMSEIAIVTARKVRLQQWAVEGVPRASAALSLANAPNEFLSTVQVGITLVGILAGAFGGATIAEVVGEQLNTLPLISPYGEAIGLAVVVLVITYLSLIIGELTPKRLALNNPERIAVAVARPMRSLSTLASPVVRLLGWSTDVVLRLMGVHPSPESPVTEEEIELLIEQGAQAGVFHEAEEDIVKSVFRLADRRVGALMTPRTEIVWLDLDDAPEEIRLKIAASGHSRLPVAQGSLDNVLGIVGAKDMLSRAVEGRALDLKAIMRHPLFVVESLSGLQLLETLKKSRTHIALVVDEYGGIQGLVTVNDILESIVGELPTRDEPVEPQAILRDDGSWLLDGMLLIDEFEELFEFDKLPEEEKGRYQTLGGFVMTHLGHIPISGEHFEFGGWRFEVMDMDAKRVDKVLAAPLKK